MGKSFLSLIYLYPLYNIFTGSNTWKEWWLVLKSLVWKGRDTDESIIRGYELAFAQHVGVQYAFSFGAGRMALYAVLKALGVKEGDEIIVSGYTCVVVPNAVIYLGAKPIYSDIDLRTFNQLPESVEKLITSRTRAIIVQHTFGLPCDLDKILHIAKQYQIPLIEDCAHSQGAFYQGKAVGSFGDAAFFTTDHTKISSTHLGGMAVCNNVKLGEQIRKVQEESKSLKKSDNFRIAVSFLIEFILYAPAIYRVSRFLLAALNRLGVLFYWRDEFHTSLPTQYPYPSLFSARQALLGLSQLQKLQENLLHRRHIAKILSKNISSLQFSEEALSTSSWLRFSFLVKDRAAFENRYKKFFRLGIWFTSVVHGRNTDLEKVFYIPGSCPNAEIAANYIVNFPTHPRIPVSVIKAIAERDGEWINSQLL